MSDAAELLQAVDAVVRALDDATVGPFIDDVSTAFVADLDQARDALAAGMSFNLIHQASFLKVDIFPLTSAFNEVVVERAVSITLPGLSAELRVASAEDVLLSKLRWYRLGGESSQVQRRDIEGLVALNGSRLDRAYLGEWAAALGVTDLLSRFLGLLLLIALAACAGRTTPNDPRVAEQMGPIAARTDPAAVDEFRPDVALTDSTGECAVQPSPTGRGRVVTMSYPNRAAARVQVAVVVDGAGRAMQSSERRGLVVVKASPNASPEERQRVFAAANRTTRSTTITLDFATGQAMLVNSGGGRKDEMVIGRVADVLDRATLGRPGARVHGVLLRCLPGR